VVDDQIKKFHGSGMRSQRSWWRKAQHGPENNPGLAALVRSIDSFEYLRSFPMDKRREAQGKMLNDMGMKEPAVTNQ
jgi:hypothetical protein